MLKKSFYEIFGVAETTTDAELKNTYKRLSLLYHPDKYTGSDDTEKERRTKLFNELEKAKATLLDPQERRKYDLGLLTVDETDETGQKISSNLNPHFESRQDEIVDGNFIETFIAMLSQELAAAGLTTEKVGNER